MNYRHNNNRHTHEAIVPDDDRVLGGIFYRTEICLRDGLYMRGDIDADIDELETHLADGHGSVQDFQVWAETNWKTRQGSFDSVERFNDKLAEEQAEVFEAIALASRGEITLELGDMLWCMSALASNGGAAIDTGKAYF